MSARPRARNASGVARAGAAMLPFTASTRDSPARRTRIGHSPPTVCIWGLTRPSTNEAATAASMALPPALSTSAPAFADRLLFEATAPRVPISRGWKVRDSVGRMR
jgi:hypothetical protein